MNQAQINTQSATSARPSSVPLTSRVIQDLDQSIDMLEILWIALSCQSLHDAETVTRASTVLYSALEILKPLVRAVDAASDDLHDLLRADPILEAIWNYTNGCAAYDSVDEADKDEIGEAALVSKTYGPPMDVLDNWTSPAVTAKGAREALSFALQECTISGAEPRIENMIRAAYDYFKFEGGVA